MSKFRAKSKSKSKSKSNNKTVNQNIQDIKELQALIQTAITSNGSQVAQNSATGFDSDMLEKLHHQLERLAKYEAQNEQQMNHNREVNEQLNALQTQLNAATKENNKLSKSCKSLTDKLNQYQNAFENIKTALDSKSLELLSSLLDEFNDVASIRDAVLALEQNLTVSKSLSTRIINLNARLMRIGNSSEKNTGKSSNSSKSTNDDDKGLSFSSHDQLMDQEVQDLAQICEEGAPKREYLLEQSEYQNKYHEQLSSVSNMESIKALSALINEGSDAPINAQAVTTVLFDVLEDVSKIVVSKTHTNGDLYEPITISIDEQVDKYAADIVGTRHRLSTKATSVDMICPLCNKTHTFKISHIVRENSVMDCSNNKLHKVLVPEYLLKSQDPNCQHSFECSLSLLNVCKVLFEEFDVSKEKVKEILSNTSLSEEERLSLANKAFLEKDNSLNNPENANYITTDVKAHARKYKQAKNVPMSYDESKHKEHLKASLSQQEGNVAKVDDINNSARKAKAREIEYNSDIANVATEHTIIEYNGVKVIDPINFNYKVNGAVPLFKGVSLSIEAIAVAAALKCLYPPTNAIHTMFANAVDDCEICSRQTYNAHVLDLGRVVHGVNQQSKVDIISRSSSILADETTGKVRSGENKKIENYYIWAIRTGKTEEQQECCFESFSSRSKESCISFLKPIRTLRAEQNQIKVKTDGYGVYASLFSKGCFADNVQHSSCFTHGRRPFHVYLKDSGLLTIYNDELLPKDTEFSQFGSNLKKFLANHPEAIKHTDLAILIVYYLINAIFAVDGMVNAKHTDYTSVAYKDELTEARNTHSVKLLYILNKIMELLAGKLGLLIYNEKRQTYKMNPDLIYKDMAKGVLYWFNSRNTMSNFIDSPDIELSQSGVERAIRPLAIGRRVSFWMDSPEGLSAYANIHNIITNCMYAEVDVTDYLIWVQANIRQRAWDLMANPDLIKQHEKEIRKISGMPYKFSDEVLKMPSRSDICQNVKDKEGKECCVQYKVGIYDPRNTSSAWLNLISYKGLTPKDYKALLARKK